MPTIKKLYHGTTFIMNISIINTVWIRKSAVTKANGLSKKMLKVSFSGACKDNVET